MSEGKTVNSDVAALAHKFKRSISMAKPHLVNALSVKDAKTIRQWEDEGRDNLTERSRMYSSTRDSQPPSDGGSERSMQSLYCEPLSSCNAQYAITLLRDRFGVDSQICDNMKQRMHLTTPITVELKRQDDKGLTVADVQGIRKGLLREAGCLGLMKQLEGTGKMDADSVKDLNMSESAVAFFKNIYYGECPEIMTGEDPTYKDLRKVVRTTNSKLFVNATANEHFSVRDWFTSRGIQPRPVYTCSLVSNSDLLLGQGPNGGHGGTGLYATDKGDKDKKGKENLNQNLTRMTSHIRELWMSGSDINQRIFHRVNRDEEVLGFLVGLKQMKVGVVIALGFPRSYNMLNVKTMIYGKNGYADTDLFSKPGMRSVQKMDECYKRNTARDFFNYFGARDGDDGLPWRDLGGGVRKCQIEDFELTSRLLKTLKNEAGWPMDIYELHVSWSDGCLCSSIKEEMDLKVINIRTWDQSPSMLVADQVSELVDTVLDVDPENCFVFIHCAGGKYLTSKLHAFTLSLSAKSARHKKIQEKKLTADLLSCPQVSGAQATWPTACPRSCAAMFPRIP